MKRDFPDLLSRRSIHYWWVEFHNEKMEEKTDVKVEVEERNNTLEECTNKKRKQRGDVSI